MTKKCPYCNFNKGKEPKELLETREPATCGGYPGTDIYLTHNGVGTPVLNVEAEVNNPARDDVYESVEINYCPMCGRKLNDENSR